MNKYTTVFSLVSSCYNDTIFNRYIPPLKVLYFQLVAHSKQNRYCLSSNTQPVQVTLKPNPDDIRERTFYWENVSEDCFRNYFQSSDKSKPLSRIS